MLPRNMGHKLEAGNVAFKAQISLDPDLSPLQERCFMFGQATIRLPYGGGT